MTVVMLKEQHRDPESVPRADLRALRAALEDIDTDLPQGPAADRG